MATSAWRRVVHLELLAAAAILGAACDLFEADEQPTIEVIVPGVMQAKCMGKLDPREACNEQDDDCDGLVDEGVQNACGTCGATPAETCDGSDNDCNGGVDEGCECLVDTERSCGAELGECVAGTQTCRNGRWGTCDDAVLPDTETCDGKDNDCDGDVDESCECRNAATRPCVAGSGQCAAGEQTCQQGSWSACVPRLPAQPERCDGLDNDCDGAIDDGFDLDLPCDSTGDCPQVRICSQDGSTSVCAVAEHLFSDEGCDGIDNDCDGLVDVVSERGSLRSLCECQARDLSTDKVLDVSVESGLNLCATTRCTGVVLGFRRDGTCYPACQLRESDPDRDGWGWENGASCLVEGSAPTQGAQQCSPSMSSDLMSIAYCLDCTGGVDLAYAMCETNSRFDLNAFGTGEEWLKVDYTYVSNGPARAPVNLWVHAGDERRKHLPLVRVGDAPGRQEKLLRVDDACFRPAALFGSDCVEQGEPCAHCGPDEVCGSIDACGEYDLSNAWLQLAAEFCAPESGLHMGTVTLHRVQLVEPSCRR